MWSALRDAAAQITTDVTDVLDELTTDGDPTRARPRHVDPHATAAPASSPGQPSPAGAPEVAAPAASSPPPAPRRRSAGALGGARGSDDDTLDAAAAALSRWFTAASSEVGKVVDRVENALETGIDKSVEVLHGLVDGGDGAAGDAAVALVNVATESDRVENALDRADMDVLRCTEDALSCTEMAQVKAVLVGRLDEAEEVCRQQHLLLNRAAQEAGSARPDLLERARQCAVRLEELLARRDRTLAAVLQLSGVDEAPCDAPGAPEASAAEQSAAPDAGARDATPSPVLVPEAHGDAEAAPPPAPAAQEDAAGDGRRSCSMGSDLVHVPAVSEHSDDDLVEVAYPNTPTMARAPSV
eukprot:TRINITY_DN526_c0_g1_i1.p1 TRINITY_DN526_c0_g1~~TRINITY_DN526_c0_g1_i1.p1  ORF type:complete len:356 (+),score=85.29 TRINITY_DN526_c0_g1_i1:175-1242(+)